MLLFLGCLALSLFAQDQTPVFRSDTRLVVLHATVVDKDGKFVPNLSRGSFQVFENGAPQEIKIFRQEDAPVSIGLVIDKSASMRDKRTRVEAASIALVKASNPDDEVFIITFNEEPRLDQDFTSDVRALQSGLAARDVRGATAMRDAIRMGLEHLQKKGQKDKKVLVVVTDGEDNESRRATAGSLVADAQEMGVQIHAIGLLGGEDPAAAKRAKRDLDLLTSASGGQAYYPKSVEEVDGICARVAHDLRTQYTIAYSPTNQALDGTYRQIKVTNNAVHLAVRTRSGYYAGGNGRGD